MQSAECRVLSAECGVRGEWRNRGERKFAIFDARTGDEKVREKVGTRVGILRPPSEKLCFEGGDRRESRSDAPAGASAIPTPGDESRGA